MTAECPVLLNGRRMPSSAPSLHSKLTQLLDIPCRMRVGHLPAAVATMDLLVAVHRGRANSSGPRVLHPVHRDEPLHHIRHSHRCVLRPSDGDVHPVLAYLEGDGEATEGPAKPAGRQEGQQQAVQLQVVSTLPNNSNLCWTASEEPCGSTQHPHRLIDWHTDSEYNIYGSKLGGNDNIKCIKWS
jgi:hypothetical protein